MDDNIKVAITPPAELKVTVTPAVTLTAIVGVQGPPGPSGTGVAEAYHNYGLSTGIITRGLLAIDADPTKIQIPAGSSLYVDNSNPLTPVVEVLTWGTQVITPPNLDTAGRLWVGVSRVAPSIGVIVFSPEFTAAEKRVIATLGRVWGNGTNVIEGVGQYSEPAWGYAKTLVDLMHALGSLNISGNAFYPVADSLLLGKSAGESFRFSAVSGLDLDCPNIVEDAPQPAISAYHYRLTQGSQYTTLKDTIDPDNYDLLGVLTPVPADKYTCQRLYYYPRSGVVDVGYGQEVYDTLPEAIEAISSGSASINDGNDKVLFGSILRGWVVVKQGCSNLGDANIAKVITATTSVGGSAAATTTRHNLLAGLNEGDYQHLSALELAKVQDSSRMRKITTSPLDPSGGADGDIWIKYIP